ncbi:MAG: GntR family transcriptional regulator, partial [Spirochaetia bacterium]|nr:GntR family transcriptional regulator [Spirochaetia bacterium]
MAARFKYEQILENLTESIHSGEYSPGSKLPSAQNLAEKFNTTQITANKALNILSTQG